MDEFLLRALLAGLGVAVMAGPLGAFVVWRRMAYFGDTLAHSALLGVALAFLLQLDVNLGVLLTSVAIALLLAALQQQRRLSSDTVLGILSHGALALGLVLIAFLETLRVDLFAYLFGDILAVGWGDVGRIWGGALLVFAVLALLWRQLLAITVHEEIASVEGTPVAAVRLALTLLFAVVVALAMKLVGILLITALLIIPAAAARRLSRSPEQMAVLASLAGCLAVAGGLYGSYQFDTPAGPSVVVAAVVLFALTALVPRAGQG